MHSNKIDVILPLTSMQTGLLFHTLKNPDSVAYFEQLTFDLCGHLDPKTARQSLEILIGRHDVLRTVFIYSHVEQPRQVVLTRRRCRFHYEDFSGDESGSPDHRIRIYETADRHCSFDLSRDMLFRLSVIRTGESRFRMIFSFHHIILDGWSFGLLLNEFFEVYQALSRNEPIHPSRDGYRHFIQWIESRNHSHSYRYWSDLLHGVEQPAVIPGKTISGNEKEYNRQEALLKLDPGLSDHIDETVRNMHWTPNVFFQTLWGILLGRYNNSRDVVFGTVVSGRHAEIQDGDQIIGLLMNTIPVRVRTEPRMSLHDLFASVQKQRVASHDHDFCSLSKIQSDSNFGRNFLDHIFAFENYAQQGMIKTLTGETGLFPFQIENVRLFEQTHYDFNLIIVPGRSLEIRVIYNANRFSSGMIYRILNQLREAAVRALDHFDMPVDEIGILSEEEEKTLRRFGRVDIPGPADFIPVHRIFEQTVNPDSSAVIEGVNELTYGALNARANRLAWFLKEQGVGPEKIVGVRMERSSDLIVGLLAVLKSGGAYLPMDKAAPDTRILHLIRTSGMNCLLTSGSIESPFSREIPVHRIDHLPEIENYPAENPGDPVSPDQLMYVIYTSGSTGEPKGVMIEHGAFHSLLVNHQNMFGLASQDRCTQGSSPAFDAMALEVWPCLTRGASLDIVPDPVRSDPGLLKEWMLGRCITFSFQITPIAESLISLSWPESAPLRILCTGGDRLKRGPSSSLPFRFFNLYGPTEDTVVTTCFEVTGPSSGPPPIGKPLDGHPVWVLDDEGRLAPAGCTGELVIGGIGLARGYLNNPVQTQEKFVNSPVSGGRIYKTGDLVRWSEDGLLEYIGRKDAQVQIGGNRVEPGEVEFHIMNFPGIIDCTVIAAGRQQSLCGYYTSETEMDKEHLFRHLKETLPFYMVPACLIRLDKIPRNMNGKVDRALLPDPGPGLQSCRPGVKPGNPVEKDLCDCWKEILELEDISIHDNFFDLGGNSLKAIEVQARLSSRFDIRIQDIYDHPTIAQLAEQIMTRPNQLNETLEEMEHAVETLKVIRNRVSLESEQEAYRSVMQVSVRLAPSEAAFLDILLTGATGFLGAHLLYDLLKSTDARIHCLVRSGEQTAADRLRSRLRFYFGECPDEWFSDRIHVLEGDLSEDNLGLKPEDYQNVLRLDSIIHSAADVRHFGHPDEFHRSNVRSVLELIHLAGEGNLKVFHHISTMGVGMAYTQSGLPRLFTEIDEQCDLAYENPYIHSKLQAETLLFRARQTGLDARIYRVGNLMAHSETGQFQINISGNAFYQVLKQFLSIGMIPDIPFVELDFSFIDQASRVLVSLMAQRNPEQATWHVFNPNTISFAALGRLIQEAGRAVRTVPVHEFFSCLGDLAGKDSKKNVQILIQYLRTLVQGPLPYCIPRCEKMQRFTAGRPAGWKRLNQELMEKILSYGERTRYWRKS